MDPTALTSQDETLADYLAALRDHRPCYLKALPEYLQMLANYSLRTGEPTPTIPVIKPMGALMTPAMKAPVEQAFGCKLREDYGSNELGPMAFDCRFRSGLHLLTDHFHFEFVRDGRAAEDGELAELLATDLHNRVMPMIRYQIGDLVRVDRTPCECGRTSPRITLQGRVQDMIVTPAGKSLPPRDVYEFFFQQPGISQFQLIERSRRRWDLTYVPDQESPSEPLGPEALAARFAAWAEDDRPLHVREVASLLAEASGKFRHIKSRSFQ